MTYLKQPMWIRFFITGTAVFCLLHIISLLPDLQYFIGDNAIIIDDIASYHSSSITPTIHSISGYVSSHIGKHEISLIIIGIYMVALLLMIANRYTFWAALVALLVKIIINNSMNFYIYGLDYFEVIALFYTVVFVNYEHTDEPVKGFKKLFKQENLLRFLQLHLFIVYFFGGFGKMLGYNWWNGESIWKALHLYESPDFLNSVFLMKASWLWTSMGIFTIFLELLYPVFMSFPKTRKVWLAGILLMHTFIGIFIGLHFFAAFMIFLNISAFYIPYLKEASFHPLKLSKI